MKMFLSIVIILNLVLPSRAQVEKSSFLFTDRTLYVAGEKILFSASLVNDSLSSVYYCELVTAEGMKVSGGKFTINNSHVAGSLTIQSGTITGNYYLRGYTREMRNKGASSFPHLRLKIINPYRKELAREYPLTGFADSITSETPGDGSLDISASREDFVPGDSVKLTISGNPALFRSINLCVVPFLNNGKVQVESDNTEGRVFSKEISGVNLTGSVQDKVRGTPAINAKVNLSILGTGRDFMAVETDSSGHFSFTLRGYSGNHDLFLSTGTGPDTRILVDNDFYAMPVRISSEKFTLMESEREAALKLTRNYQVDSIFARANLKEEPVRADNSTFYGTPDETLVPAEFVKLSTLEDYFNELPSLVRVRKKDGRKYFKVAGPQTELTELYPLVLVDMVAIDDVEKVLGADPAAISRIDIINSVYLKGDQLYGGIISIISRKGDFAGTDLPASGIFINYGFPAKQAAKDEISLPEPGRPDARNTLLWIPQLDLSQRKELYITAPDTPGGYVVILRGVTSKNKVIMKSLSFRVLSHK